MRRPLRAACYAVAVKTWSAWLTSILRIVASFLFMAHGTQKLFAYPVARPSHPMAWWSLLGVAGILEAFGGALLLVGLFTRPVAVVLAGEMAVAFLRVHAPRGFWPILNGGELSILYCFLFLYLAAAGGGPLSLDALIRKRRGRDTT